MITINGFITNTFYIDFDLPAKKQIVKWTAALQCIPHHIHTTFLTLVCLGLYSQYLVNLCNACSHDLQNCFSLCVAVMTVPVSVK